MDIAQTSSNFLQTVGEAASATSRYLPEPVASGVDFAGQLLRGPSDGSSTIELSPTYQELINRQIQSQMELQQVTFLSNIERSQHETRMAAVRNIRVG